MSFASPLQLPEGCSVLVAGCGGGYDVVCGLPVALALRARGHAVHLSSYSFTDIDLVPGATSELPGLMRIDSRCEPPPECGYFPEGFLCKWWEQRFHEDIPVWCYRRTGVMPLAEIFAFLKDKLGLDAIVMVDAGVDALFYGNEYDLGSPVTDAISVLAAYLQKNLERRFVFTAFGSEGFEQEVRHADALERITELIRGGAMHGVSALLERDEPGRLFLDALGFLHQRMEDHWHSNMASSLAAAMRGHFGLTAVNRKTQTSKIWISPLTLLYWFFDLAAVAERKPYLAEGLRTERVGELAQLIEKTRERMGVLPRRDIPI